MTETDIYLYWIEYDNEDIDGFFMLPTEETAQSDIWSGEPGEIHIVWW